MSGISGYGNSVGVPTVGGEVVFDDCYRDNPLVNVLCLGILPHERLVLARAEGPGNLAVLLGSSTGRDGIGGASVLASAGFEAGSEEKRPSVQVGDPFEEKRLIEACLELLDRRLAVGVQDLGAAGLSCAASETAAKAGMGMDVDAARVARREPGMSTVELLTSESQERMLAIVEPHQLDAVLELAERWEVRAEVVGRVTDTGRFRVFDGVFDAWGVPGHAPAPPLGDEPLPISSDRAPEADVPAGSLGDGPVLPPSPSGSRRSRRAAGRRSRAAAAREVRRRRRSLGRAARAARDADDRGEAMGVEPVRPPALPEHRGRAGRRRRGAAGEGHDEGVGALDRRQGPLLPPRSAYRRSARRARSGAQRRVRGRVAARARQLPQLRQSGAPRGDVVVRRGRRGHRRGVRDARAPRRRRQRRASTTSRSAPTSIRRPSSRCSASSTSCAPVRRPLASPTATASSCSASPTRSSADRSGRPSCTVSTAGSTARRSRRRAGAARPRRRSGERGSARRRARLLRRRPRGRAGRDGVRR